MRYLIGSQHGWLGAIGFGPAAFVLRARDQWIGWSTGARLSKLNQVVGLARLLIRQEVSCANLASRALSLGLPRLPSDWQARYGLRPVLVETFVDCSQFTGRTFGAANWQRIGTSSGRSLASGQNAQRYLGLSLDEPGASKPSSASGARADTSTGDAEFGANRPVRARVGRPGSGR